jgi:murein DD-endopeptidase MepM/ murein hydrolase activator NlpD
VAFHPSFLTSKTERSPVLKLDSGALFPWAFALLFLLAGYSASAQEQKLIRISTQKEGDKTHFVVENLQYADVTVTIEIELKNLKASQAVPYTATIPPRGKADVFDLTPENPKQDSSWSYTYYATWGSLSVEHDNSYVYALPFPSGMAFPVSQGFHGKYSHMGGDCFSIDFKMPEGTPVLAARGGTVVGTKDDSSKGGGDKKYEWDANYILIRHSDGTLGHYVHLKKGGVRVKIGDVVEPGQWIGLSGNTGHSTGAHLHFAVFKASSGKQRETIPIKYYTDRVLAEVLSEGKTYKAFEPMVGK